MAIPITCPGCQAGFEVPENLAGKTIRCTSCKTQLSVPAADARKPFGHAAAKPAAPTAGRPSQPAIKAAPVKAAAAVDDDDDDRKTSPSKPASRNGPTIKGAIKSGSSKRRDDDDDDDDRPRRKKSSKAAGSGGGIIAMLGGGVVCIGAIVGLAVKLLSDDSPDTTSDTDNTAQVTRTGDTGEGNTRNTEGGDGTRGGRDRDSDDGSGAVENPDRPEGGTGMRPGMRPRPGAGNVGAGGGAPFIGLDQIGDEQIGTPGSWAKYDGDGFSAEFPGRPEQKASSTVQGQAMRITAVGSKSEGIAAVMFIQLPPEALQAANGANAKQLVDLMKEGARQQFGGRPIREVTVSGFPGAALEVNEASASVDLRMVLAHDRIYMFIAGGNKKGGAAMSRDQRDRFFNSATITYKGGGEGATVASGGPGGIGGPPRPGFPGAPIGRGAGSLGAPPTPGTFTPQPGGGGPGGLGAPPSLGGFTRPGVGAPGGNGVPTIPGGLGTPPNPAEGGGAQVGGAIGDEPPPNPGGGIPAPGGGFGRGLPGGGLGQPPGGGFGRGLPGGGLQPGGGQPGGAFGSGLDSNPAPFGSATDGNMKANVDTFFAAVFDGEKKELFTFSARAERSITTKLNRFDLATNFSKAGSFKVPNFVTRAVIDPAKGLLYAATITRPSVSALDGQKFDQAVGVGDVQIFDLNPIRDGKVKDGADFRPVATIAFGRTIRGLELSNDGKSLFVVSSTSGKSPKSFLAVYDTETRKPTGDAKTLDNPAWDMCKSPDGKHLLIIDMVEPNKASWVRMYDTTTLVDVKRLSLHGAGNDVAATTGGQYAAAVGANGIIKLVLASDSGTRDLEGGFGWKAAAKPGYVEYSRDGKTLFVSGHPSASGSYPRQGQPGSPAGFDVYEVTDADSPTGYKKKASIRTAGGNNVGGHFVLSPDGDYVVFHTGVVIETANIGGNNGEAAAGAGNVPGGLTPPGPGAGEGAIPQPGGQGLPGRVGRGVGGGGAQPGGAQPPPAGNPDDMRRRGGQQQPPPGSAAPPGGNTDDMRRRGGQQQPPPGSVPPGGSAAPPGSYDDMRRRGGQQQPPPGGER